MARINSIVGRFSGNVAYMDGSNGTYHCQMECDDISDLYWSVDEVISKITTSSIDVHQGNPEWTTTLSEIFSSIPGSTFIWSSTYAPAKEIRDLVHHLTMTITTDTGVTLPISVTFENGELRDHYNIYSLQTGTYIDSLDNINAIVAKIQTMLALICDPGFPVFTV